MKREMKLLTLRSLSYHLVMNGWIRNGLWRTRNEEEKEVGNTAIICGMESLNNKAGNPTHEDGYGAEEQRSFNQPWYVCPFPQILNKPPFP